MDGDQKIDVDLIEEILAFSRNIHQTYVEAPTFLKRHYLRFFFESFEIKGKKIYKVNYTPIFKTLQNTHKIIVRRPQLPQWNTASTENWLRDGWFRGNFVFKRFTQET